MPLIDLSHEIFDGMITYPGLPGPVITDHLTREDSVGHYEEGVSFHIGRMDLIANTGTYLDTPSHRHAGMADLADLDLAQVADLAGLLVDASEYIDEIPAPAFDEAGAAAGGALLIRTDWSRHWGTDAYTSGHPHLGDAAIDRILEIGPRLVGIDSLNIDGTRDGRRPAHTRLLAAGILIVEHLTNLAALPPDGFRFWAVPPKVAGMGTFPVRAFAGW
jgi:kynurenine formamidase